MGSGGAIGLSGVLGLDTGAQVGYWDYNATTAAAHKVCDGNFTPVGEAGMVFRHSTLTHPDPNDPLLYWRNVSVVVYEPFSNSTGIIWQSSPQYQIFNSEDGRNVVSAQAGLFGIGFNMFGAVGMIGLVTGLTYMGLIIGIKVFGVGINDATFTMMYKSTGYLALWGLFSLMAYTVIVGVPVVGVVFYFFLTFLYSLGVIGSVGGGGGD